MSRVMYVQGKPTMTAKGMAIVQNASITMVRIKGGPLLRASTRLSATRHGELFDEPTHSPHSATHTQCLPVLQLSTAICGRRFLLAREPAKHPLHAVVRAFARNRQRAHAHRFQAARPRSPTRLSPLRFPAPLA